MNAGMKNGINLLMILVLFISCVQEKEDNNVLRRVEACMELFPDSALSLLSHPSTGELNEKAPDTSPLLSVIFLVSGKTFVQSVIKSKAL